MPCTHIRLRFGCVIVRRTWLRLRAVAARLPYAGCYICLPHTYLATVYATTRFGSRRFTTACRYAHDIAHRTGYAYVMLRSRTRRFYTYARFTHTRGLAHTRTHCGSPHMVTHGWLPRTRATRIPVYVYRTLPTYRAAAVTWLLLPHTFVPLRVHAWFTVWLRALRFVWLRLTTRTVTPGLRYTTHTCAGSYLCGWFACWFAFHAGCRYGYHTLHCGCDAFLLHPHTFTFTVPYILHLCAF